MIRLALWALKTHPARFLGPGVALLMAASVAATSGILLESALRTNPTEHAFASASVVVGGGQIRPSDDSGSYEGLSLPDRVRVPDDAGSRLADLPSVADVVEFRSTQGTLSADDSSAGASAVVESWPMAAVGGTRLAAGRYPTALDEAVIPRQWAAQIGSAVGDAVVVRTVAGDFTMVAVGVTDEPEDAGMPARVLVSDAANTLLSGTSAPPEFLAVVAEPSVPTARVDDDVRRALEGTAATVLTPENAAEWASMDVVSARQDLSDLSGTFGGLALLVGVFVAVSTLGLAATQSSRDFALLRAIGATPRQIRRLMVRQSMLVALMSGVIGCLAAPWLARLALESLVDHGIIAGFVTVQASWIPFVSTMGGVMAVAWLASILATRKLSQIRPVDALGDSAEEAGGIGTVRVMFGLLVLAGAALVSQVRMPGGGASNQAATASLVVLALMIATGVLGPSLARIGALLLSPLLRAVGRVGRLAASNSRFYAPRTASAMTTIALLIALAALTIFVPSFVESSTRAAASDREQDTWRIRNEVGFSPADLQEARQAEGVAAAIGLQRTVVIHGRTSTIDFEALSVSGDELDKVLDLGIRHGSIPADWESGIVLSEQVAESWRAEIGDRVEVLMSDGRLTKPQVVATFSHSIGFADVLLPSSMSTVGAAVDELVVKAGSDSRDTLSAVRAALDDPTLSVVRSTDSDSLHEDTALNLWLTRRLLGLVCLMSAVAVVTTIVAVTLSRRREVAALRLIGATNRQITAMIESESLAVWGVGTAQGLGVACVALLPLVSALPGARLQATPATQMLAVVIALGVTCAAGSAASSGVGRRNNSLNTAAGGPG